MTALTIPKDAPAAPRGRLAGLLAGLSRLLTPAPAPAARPTLAVAADGVLELRVPGAFRIVAGANLEVAAGHHLFLTSGRGPVPGKRGLRYSCCTNTDVGPDGDPILRAPGHVPYRDRRRTHLVLARMRRLRHCGCGGCG